MAITTKTDAGYSELFKRTYGEYGDNLYGSGIEDPLEGLISKKFDLKGTDHRFPIKIGFGGGTSFGSLGQANRSKQVEVVLNAKNAYARMNLDRKTIVQSRGKQAAFKEATSEETEGKLKSFNRTQACALYNDGTGILVQFTGPATGTAAAPVFTALNTGTYRFRSGFVEEGDYVEIVSAGSVLPSLFEITDVNVSTRAVTLSRISGGDDLTALVAGTYSVVLQKSYNQAPMGIKGAAEFSSGTLYSVTYQRRFSPYSNALASAALISVDHLNKLILQQDNRAGEPPTHLIFSTIQMEKFLNQLEDKKRYPATEVSGGSNKLNKKAVASFSGIEFMGPRGAIPILSSRYVHDDVVYGININKMFRKHAEEFGWFSDDGTVLLRMQDLDAYEARYGGYYDNFINPLHVASISNLAV